MKVSLFIVLILLGVWQRKLLKKWSFHLAHTLFKRNVFGEMGVLVIVLLLTSVLVDVSPDEARQGIKLRSEPSDQVEQVEVTPLRAGANDVMVRLREGVSASDVKVNISSSSGWTDEYQAFQIDSRTFKVTGNLFHSPGTLTMDVLVGSGSGENTFVSYVVYVPGPME
jgi:copper transport protein